MTVPLMWMYGTANAGKSPMAKSVARWCEEENLLLASFFFARSDPSRNYIRCFIPTPAYSMVQCIPEGRHLIEQAVGSDPLIFSRSLSAQISYLIIRPLSTLAQTVDVNDQWPCVVIDSWAQASYYANVKVQSGAKL